MMIFLIARHQPGQDLDRVGRAGCFNYDLLQPTGQSRILLDKLTIFVTSGSADQAKLTPSQSGF